MRRRRPSDRDSEDSGFTLVELLVAMLVIGGTLLGLITVQVGALRTVNLAKQRQQATALANRTMEQLRALPYDTVTGGLRSSDLTGDPNIAAGRFRPAYDAAIDEILVVGSSASAAPLYPHRQVSTATELGNVQFAVSSYVTLVSATAGDTTKGYWLTVVVTWDSGASAGGSKIVTARSQLFSPTGCLSTARHPFSGPCQAFHDATAGSTPAGVFLTSADETQPALLTGNDLKTASVTLPSLSTGVQSEQTVSASGKAATSGAAYADTLGESTTGEQAATTGASTDPATGGGSAPASDAVTQSPTTTLTSAGLDSSFALRAASGDSASSHSTTSAGTGCKDLANVAIASGQACASGQVVPSGALSASLTYGAAIPLASVAAASSPSRAFSARYASSATTYCTGTFGAGCISANVSRAVGATSVGGVPTSSSLVPPGFTAMVTVDGYTDRAGADSGVGAQPATAQRTGTLNYWNGTTYTSIDLAGAGAASYALAPVTVSYTGTAGVAVTIGMTGSVSVAAAGSTSTGAAPCQPVACGTTSTAGSVLASVTYDVAANGVRVGYFTVTLDLGSSLARTSYRAAPSA